MRVGFDMHLLKDARTVCADGLYAQEQFVRDFGHCLTVRELAKHLELPVRQVRVRRFRLFTLKLSRELIAERRTYVAAAG